MSVLGGEFALVVLVSGSWSAVAKLESQVPIVGKKSTLTTTVKYTEARAVKSNMVPYLVDVVSMDQPGIVHDVAEFFAGRQINIEEMTTWTCPAAHARHADVLDQHDRQRPGERADRQVARGFHGLLRRTQY